MRAICLITGFILIAKNAVCRTLKLKNKTKKLKIGTGNGKKRQSLTKQITA
jgi:hypothetical protein